VDRLYFVSNPSTSLDPSLSIVNTLVQSLENTFPTAARQSPWSLQYRAFRDTIPPGTPSTDAEGKPTQYAHTLQHLFHLSSLEPNRAFICIQPPSGTGTVSAIPLSQQDAHASLVRHQFAALWQPRHVLALQQGASYTAGICTVQIGELRAIREGPQSGGIQSPGVLICISTIVGADNSDENTDTLNSLDDGDEEVDFEYAQEIIRDCWRQIKDGQDLGKSEIKQVMMDSEYVDDIDEKDAAVRMWCEVLRLRG